ncbi:MAG: ankyrin repeat domain-containing protein [Acidobacteria bacterium]|nr:ankyrin repeat domain-containing protein [Acidobacteriota bacterium]
MEMNRRQWSTGLTAAVAGVLLSIAAPTAAASAEAEASLIAAARAGDGAAVAALLDGAVDVDASETGGMTALHWAVQGDAAHVVALLLDAGADATAPNRYGVAPLTLAAINGNAAIVSRLLSAGADPNRRLAEGETGLMTAARTGRPAVVQALLAAGADPNASEPARGQTALMWAAAENNVGAIRVLVANGADVAARTGDPAAGEPGGVFSAEVGLTRDARSGPSFTALLFAVQLGQLDAARTLLDLGADVNDTFPDGTSALVVAAMNGQHEVGIHLIDQGAAVNAAEQGWNALHQVIRLRRTNIGHMPPPEGRGNLSSMDLIHALLEAGVDVNAPMTADFRDGYRNRLNRVGATPFLLASKNVDTEVMRVLLDARADPLVPNVDLTTPLMVAAGVDMWNPGEDGGATVEHEPEALEAVRMLVDLGNDIHAVNDRGETALHGAAYRGAPSIVDYLVEQGAQLDARSAQGWTPWTIANGVFYSLFYKEQPATADRLAELMAERGMSTAGMADELRTCFDCGRNRGNARDAEGRRVAQPTPDRVPSAVEPAAQEAAQPVPE